MPHISPDFVMDIFLKMISMSLDVQVKWTTFYGFMAVGIKKGKLYPTEQTWDNLAFCFFLMRQTVPFATILHISGGISYGLQRWTN